MLSYSDITAKKIIVLNGEPYEVLSSQTKKKNRQKPANQTRIKNLITGNVTDQAFHQSDKVEEAEIEKIDIVFLYENKGEWWFSEVGNPKNRFVLTQEQVGEAQKYLTENERVTSLRFNGAIFSLSLPAKVDVKVTDAPPNIKGNTSSGGDKVVTLETGATVTTPLFIEVGDVIRINTETGAYTERVSKGP